MIRWAYNGLCSLSVIFLADLRDQMPSSLRPEIGSLEILLYLFLYVRPNGLILQSNTLILCVTSIRHLIFITISMGSVCSWTPGLTLVLYHTLSSSHVLPSEIDFCTVSLACIVFTPDYQSYRIVFVRVDVLILAFN